MSTGSLKQRMGKWLVAILLVLGYGFASAQQEPTMNQIYDTARAGRMDQAQSMVQQVIKNHPNSAKAHFVQAELYANQGKVSSAREALAIAERIAPGLPFAKAETVSALRSQLSSRTGLNGLTGAGNGGGAGNTAPTKSSAPARDATPASSLPSFGWFWPLLLIGGALAIGIMMFRRKSAQARPGFAGTGAADGGTGGFNGPQGFGTGNASTTAGMPVPGSQAYAQQPGQQQPGQGPGQQYPQQQGSGMGGRIAGGLATGAAIGAGMLAAQAIGKSLSGNDAKPAPAADNSGSGGGNDPAGNNLGGQNFGINDTSSWDDGGSSGGSDAGGGDWDN